MTDERRTRLRNAGWDAPRPTQVHEYDAACRRGKRGGMCARCLAARIERDAAALQEELRAAA